MGVMESRITLSGILIATFWVALFFDVFMLFVHIMDTHGRFNTTWPGASFEVVVLCLFVMGWALIRREKAGFFVGLGAILVLIALDELLLLLNRVG